MLRNLLSPLRSAGFESILSPRSPSQNTSASPGSPLDLPEDFQRDVRMDIMRKTTEDLKEQSSLLTLSELNELMDTILRIMDEDQDTIQVFRELDGVLGLLSALQVVSASISSGQPTTTRKDGYQAHLQGIKLVFQIISHIMNDQRSRVQFQEFSGFGTISDILRPVIASNRVSGPVLGILLSFALSDFSPRITSFFSTDNTPQSASLLSSPILRNTRAISVLVSLLPTLSSYSERVALAGVILQIGQASPVNQSTMAQPQIDIIGQLIPLAFPSPSEASALKIEDGVRPLLLKIMRALLPLSCSVASARTLFERALRPDRSLDAEVLSLLADGFDTRGIWPSFVSIGTDGRAQTIVERAIGPAGFTFMTWIYLPRLTNSEARTRTLMTLTPNPPVSARFSIRVSIRSDGSVQYETSSSKGHVRLFKARLKRGEWSHLGVVHTKSGSAGEASCSVYINGQLSETVPTPYPKVPSSLQMSLGTTPVLSTPSQSAPCFLIGPTHLFSYPLPQDMFNLPRVLGPQYTGRFQSGLVRFLTYSGATTLNIHLSNQNQTKAELKLKTDDAAGVVKALRTGLHPEGQNVHAMLPGRSVKSAATDESERTQSDWMLDGDAEVDDLVPLHSAAYAIGGCSLGLRLADMSTTAQELCDSVRVLLGMLAHSWRNSEEMETYHGYDVLAGILRRKAALITEEILNILLAFVGVDQSSPERSVIANSVAYRALLLDFDLWSRASIAVQTSHLAHFHLFLSLSGHRRFNIKHRFAKLNIIRLLLYSLRFTPYSEDILPSVVDAIKSIILYHFSADNTIKPIVAYLATTLHEGLNAVRSPLTIASSTQLEHGKPYKKAMLVLEMFVSVLRHPDHLSKFCSSLPVARVLLLMLGDSPTPEVAAQIVTLLGLIIRLSPMFPRKFELANGWVALRYCFPTCWDICVQGPAFDILLGQANLSHKLPAQPQPPDVLCPFILPALLDTLFVNLVKTVLSVSQPQNEDADEEVSAIPIVKALDSLTEALLSSLGTHPTLFRSKTILSQYTKGINTFSKSLSGGTDLPHDLRTVLDKVTHLTVMLSLDEHIPDASKRELTLGLHRLQSSTSDDSSGVSETTSLLSTVFEFTGSSIARQTFARTSAWREKLVETEKERARKQLQDQREWREQVDQQIAWKVATDSHRGLWSRTDTSMIWRVDETEGPFRVRKKLEPATDDFYVGPSRGDEGGVSIAEASRSDRHIESTDMDDVVSVLRTDSAPWADTDTSLTHDHGWDEDMVDDKHRRVRRYLERGDVIQAVFTVYKIVGIDSSPGLLVLGKSHIYLLEGLVESKEGEIIDARDAPKDLLSIPSGTVVEFKRHRPEAKWAYDDMGGVSKRTCLFRDVALELYLKDSRSILLVLGTSTEREAVYARLVSPRHGRRSSDLPSAFQLRAPLASAVSSIGARFAQIGPGKAELDSATRRWQAREMSNFAYLAVINQAAGRTPNDITQYPVYPWVLQDYESKVLDMSSEKSFRDLSSPMGALTPNRREAASERYEAQMDGEAPFHYGTHFSSSMIVCHFLLRLEPFTRMFLELQGGGFDLPERLFRDVGKAWNSAAHESRGDVRELIPEFFNCPEFLENVNHLYMGTLQDGQKVDDVNLPTWAKGDPFLFISLHRQALESEHVSRMLPKWIDLVFGCKQRDIEALNVYHPLTYEGSIDLEAITDSWEREAMVGTIHNFGQTPRQVFRQPHPDRYMDGPITLPLGTAFGVSENYAILTQSEATSRKLDEPAGALYIDTVAEKVIPCPHCRRLVPQAPHESVEWSFVSQSLCLTVDRKVVYVEEETSVSAAAFYDNRLLVTGSEDSTVSVWRIVRKDQPCLHLAGTMRGHRGRINCVAVSRAWAMVVTGSEDGLVIVWDINRMRYVRSMSHDSAVHCVAIGPSGEIASSSRTALSIHTINGRLISSIRPTEPVTALAFLLREYTPVPILASSSADEIKLWTWQVDASIEDKAVWRLVLLRTLKCKKSNGQPATVTALEFVGESLYHGDDQGLVYAWTLPD